MDANDWELFTIAEALGVGELHIRNDKKSGLKAIIAIHSTKRGPALGGARLLAYPTTAAAVTDAMRLARGMSYKAALANLPLGGGKAVIILPENEIHRELLFECFGEFVDNLNGRYITAIDAGTEVNDMDIVATRTNYVTSTTPQSGHNGDPSLFTATGVRRAIQAAVQWKLGRDSVEGVHVTIQGLGHVGANLAKQLAELGARLTVTDINAKNIQHVVDDFGATAVEPDEIFDVKCDVFAPCALGAILNEVNIDHLRAPIVCGAANNQLSHRADGQLLYDKGILYAPDYAINSGGLIHVAASYFNQPREQANQQIENIYDTVTEIFERSANEDKPTHIIADALARERL